VAKLAEKLCTILDQLQLSTYDISCFNPVCPNPQSFSDLIQILIDKICALENITPDSSQTAGCPDDCIVTIAPCLQSTDFLGNTITTLSLKDYVIKIGNEVCNILTQISTLQTGLEDLESRVAYIEANCCGAGVSITVPTSCLSGGTNIPIVNFIVALETAFCDLQTEIGSIPGAIAAQCITNTDPQLSVYPAVVPTMNAILGWNTSPGNLEATIENLWLALCDARTAISTLQTTVTTLQNDLAACCAATCADIVWTFSGSGVRAVKFIDLSFNGTVPAVFDYCGVATTAPIEVTDAFGNSFTFNEDVLGAINSGAPIDLDVSAAAPVTESSVYYEVVVDLCLTDGTITCNTQRNISFYNTNWCARLNAQITTPTPGQIDVQFNTFAGVSTQFTVSILTAGDLFITSSTATYAGGTQTMTFTGLTSGTVYKARVRSTQNGRYIDCDTSSIVCA
jgi:hypothetical protein